MRILLLAGTMIMLWGTTAQAQRVDPDVRGPLRRGASAAAETLGAPGVENRIERRQFRRDVAAATPDAWRMRYYNDEWWYYTPRNTWMYYRNNAWTPYQVDNFQVAPSRYSAGYRGPIPAEGYDRFTYGRIGAPTLTIAILDGQFEPATLHVLPGTTVRWINQGNELHTVTSVDGKFDSGELEPGETYSARFKSPNVYSYVCDVHPEMKASIVVGDAATSAPVEPHANAPHEEPANGQVDVQVNPQPTPNVEASPPAEIVP